MEHAAEIKSCYTNREKSLSKSLASVPRTGNGHQPSKFKPEQHEVPTSDTGGKMKRNGIGG